MHFPIGVSERITLNSAAPARPFGLRRRHSWVTHSREDGDPPWAGDRLARALRTRREARRIERRSASGSSSVNSIHELARTTRSAASSSSIGFPNESSPEGKAVPPMHKAHPFLAPKRVSSRVRGRVPLACVRHTPDPGCTTPHDFLTRGPFSDDLSSSREAGHEERDIVLVERAVAREVRAHIAGAEGVEEREEIKNVDLAAPVKVRG